MKRVHFTSILLLLLLSCAATYAQERGDGSAQNGTKANDKGITTGRSGKRILGAVNEYNNGDVFRSKPFVPGTSDFGVKAGVNFQELATSPFAPKLTAGIVGGLYFRRYWRVTGVKIEALASSAHYVSKEPAAYYASSAKDTVSKSEFKAIYLSVPVLGELRLYHEIYIEIGPQYSHLMASSDKNGAFSHIYGKSDIFFKSEFSGVIGIEAGLPYGLKIDARYCKGLTDVNNSIYPQAYLQWTINTIQATVSYNLY